MRLYRRNFHVPKRITRLAGKTKPYACSSLGQGQAGAKIEPAQERNIDAEIGYSIFDSGVYRIHAEKWLFPQKKATFDSLLMSTSEAKML
jgi:hypothetical protein